MAAVCVYFGIVRLNVRSSDCDGDIDFGRKENSQYTYRPR